MPFDAPFKFGPFSVDAEGRLAPLTPHGEPVFLFRWRDRVTHARLLKVGNSGNLVLQTTLGRVQSTAATPDDTLRPRSFTLLHWLPRAVPDEWRVHLLADHRVMLETDRPIAMPITAAALVCEITCYLLALSPYLDLLDETGVSTAPG